MASDSEKSPGMTHDTGHSTLTLGLALLSGVGFIAMLLAMAVGVATAEPNSAEVAGEGIVGILFFLGLAAFISGIVAWIAVARPHERFDNINEPVYYGPSDSHSTAIVTTEENKPVATESGD
jgi:hypothetical protein